MAVQLKTAQGVVSYSRFGDRMFDGNSKHKGPEMGASSRNRREQWLEHGEDWHAGQRRRQRTDPQGLEGHHGGLGLHSTVRSLWRFLAQRNGRI